MIDINKCLSVKVCLFLTWLQSSWKLSEAYIWDGSEQEIWSYVELCGSFFGTSVMSFHVGIGSLGGTVYPCGTLNPSANYVIFIMEYWYRCPNSVTQKKGNIHFFTLTYSFSGCFPNLKLRKTYYQVRKYP